jgi:threonine/homoserine/homoserine lactone efflux protein
MRAASIFLAGIAAGFWVMFGVGVALAVVRDNDNLPDMLMIGGVLGILYFAFTSFAVYSGVTEYKESKK